MSRKKKYVSKADQAKTIKTVDTPKAEKPVKEEPVKEEPVKEEPVKEEPVKEEPKKEEPVKEEPVKEEPVKEEPKKEKPKKEKPKREKRSKEEYVFVKTVITNPHEKKKATFKDWLLIGISVIALLILIFIVYSTRTYDNAVSKMLQNDSKKENFTEVKTTDALDYIQINEVSAEKGVELFNSGSVEADLSGLQIMLSGRKVALLAEGTVVKAGGYAMVDLGTNPGKGENNILSVVDKDGKLIDSLMVPKLTADKNYGLTGNENFNAGFMDATWGSANKTTISPDSYTYCEGIGFSTPGGFYDSNFLLELVAGEGEKIYYTTDGTEPTTESTEYTEGIAISNQSGGNYVYARQAFGYLFKENYYPNSIDAGMVIRAIRVDASGKVKGSATQEYYVGLANDSAYANIPVISLTVEPDDMFGYFNGMYVAGRTREDAIISGEKLSGSFANYLNDWSREGKLSFYETVKDKTMELDTTVKMYVDIDIYSAQKSLTFNVQDYSSFAGSSLTQYIDKDGNILLQSFIDDGTVRVRDIIANEMMKDSKVGTIDLSPCILFIDGEYWGVYLLKAPFDSNYFEKHFGVTQDVYLRKYNGYQRDFLDMYAFVTENDMRNKENYEKVKTMMDIDNYLEYVCLNVYLGNSNFRSTKGVQWRTVNAGGSGYADGRWRWLMNYPIGNTMGKAVTQTATIDSFLQSSLRMDKFFQSLLMNDEFCKQLSKTMDSMVNERFTQENWEPVVDNATALMKKPAIDTCERFTGSLKDTMYMVEIEVIKSFLTRRGEYANYYAKELAAKGGDLEYIREQENLGKAETDEQDEVLAPEEMDENAQGEDTENPEGENTNATENSGNALNTSNGVNNQNTENSGEQGVGNNNG